MDYTENNKTLHSWKCSDSPDNYICKCGATGIWNKDLQKIEVLEPIPEELYERRHSNKNVPLLP